MLFHPPGSLLDLLDIIESLGLLLASLELLGLRELLEAFLSLSLSIISTPLSLVSASLSLLGVFVFIEKVITLKHNSKCNMHLSHHIHTKQKQINILILNIHRMYVDVMSYTFVDIKIF